MDMMKTGFLLLIAALVAGAAETPPQPHEPVLARAPARAEWTVRMTDVGGNSDAQDQRAQEAGIAETLGQQRKRVSVEFSKDSRMRTYRIHTRWNDGKSEDEWIVAGSHVAERPGGRGLYIVGAEDATAGDLAGADFPELKWLDLSFYRGIKEGKTGKVFVFTVPYDKKPLSGTEARLLALAKQSDPSATPSKLFKPKVTEVVVHLDAATQLPVMYNDGSILRNYAFAKTPDSPLRPSKEILDFLRARANALRMKLATPPGP